MRKSSCVVLVLVQHSFTKSLKMGKIHSMGINNEKSACFHQMKGLCTNWAGNFKWKGWQKATEKAAVKG